MAGLTKVAWSPTIPDSCPAGWAAAIASDPSDFSSGWVGAIGAAERAGRQDPRFGAECAPPAARQRGGGSVPRRPGSGERHTNSAELRSMRDQPTAPARAAYWHIALHPLLHAADPSNSLTHLR
ncbi:hypothetical protein [Paramuribaculum intestinale]|uniref:hypothetical protein n=1 Tax=Paramuribaculum intestinale TaxID=2094151 RepID=UPI0025A9EAE0|nr:hypothetical protein [Paramuribaculum intestinale]